MPQNRCSSFTQTTEPEPTVEELANQKEEEDKQTEEAII
jgi:hypothetical protein